MKEYGLTRSTIEPSAIEITDAKVFTAMNINTVTVYMGGEQVTEYEFNLTEYDKNEYILMMAQKNESLESELTDTQIALCDVYELLGS